jgi:hypothetical protein
MGSYYPAWSPNGAALKAYTSREGGTWICSIPPANGNVHSARYADGSIWDEINEWRVVPNNNSIIFCQGECYLNERPPLDPPIPTTRMDGWVDPAGVPLDQRKDRIKFYLGRVKDETLSRKEYDELTKILETL